MKICKYILWTVLVALCSACSVTRNKAYTPTTTQLNIQMDDLEYLGESEISVDYRTYLGFISKIDRINGVPYTGEEIRRAQINGGYLSAPGLYSKLGRATAKVLDEYPQANYFVVVRQTQNKTRLFLGADVSVRATVKAYSFK